MEDYRTFTPQEEEDIELRGIESDMEDDNPPAEDNDPIQD